MGLQRTMRLTGCSVAQPDQARIVALNAKLFLKQGGGMLISIKANCIDSTAPPEQVFAQEVEKLRSEKFFPKEQLTLEPYERDHAVSYILGIQLGITSQDITDTQKDGVSSLPPEGVCGVT